MTDRSLPSDPALVAQFRTIQWPDTRFSPARVNSMQDTIGGLALANAELVEERNAARVREADLTRRLALAERIIRDKDLLNVAMGQERDEAKAALRAVQVSAQAAETAPTQLTSPDIAPASHARLPAAALSNPRPGWQP